MMRRRSGPRAGPHPLRRLAAGAIAALALLAATAEPAAAHFVYQKAKTYASQSNCTGSRAEISHGSGGGYSKADTYSWYSFSTVIGGNVDCESNWSRPPGYILTALDHLKWNASTRKWNVCRYTNWYRNSTNTHQFAIYTKHGAVPDCGSGYYATVSWGAVYNNGWYPANGYGVYSGYHHL